MKKLLILLVLLNFTFLAFSFNYGGFIDSNIEFDGASFDALALTHNDEGTLWAKIPFDERLHSYLAMEGKYKFTLTSELADSTTLTTNHLLDLNLLKFAITIPCTTGNIDFNLGRIFISDSTANIFAQNCDGFYAKYYKPTFSCSIFGGYTGFLNSNFVSINQSVYAATDSIYSFAAKYAIAAAKVAFPNLFASQTLTAECYTAWDLEAEDSHRIYSTLTLNGGLFKNLFYVLNSSLGIYLNSMDFTAKYSNLSKIDFSYYFPVFSSSFSLSGIYASGTNSTLSEFNPFTFVESSLVSHTYSSLLKANLLYSMKPIAALFLSASTAALFTVDKDDVPFTFDGIQWEVNSKWQIVSDVSLTVNCGQYITYTTNYTDYLYAKVFLGIAF